MQALAAYLTTPEFADHRAVSGNIVSANKGLDRSLLATPIAKLSADLLADPDVTFRFDGSDLMPATVGAGTFWTEMTAWVKGTATATALHRIQGTWPPNQPSKPS